MKSSHVAKCVLFVCFISLLVSPAIMRAEENISHVDPYAARKVFYEERWQEKIEATLRYVKGAVVRVNVELTPEIERSVKTEVLEGEPVPEFVLRKTSKSSAGPFSTGPQKNPGETGTESIEEAHTRHFLPRKHVEETFAGLLPKQVSVAVIFPASYTEAIWNRRNGRLPKEFRSRADREELDCVEQEIKQRISETVAALLPKHFGTDTFCGVRVMSFEDLNTSAAEASTAGARPTLKVNDHVTITFRKPKLSFPAKITEVQPNGTWVVESRGHIFQEEEQLIQIVKFSGLVRPESLDPETGSIPADKIAQLTLNMRDIATIRK